MAVSKPGPARCVLLFARAPRAEAAAKGLRRGEALFALARNRVVKAVAALGDVDLVFVPPAAQSGGDFGERLEAAVREAALRGYGEILAVPGDVPALTAGDLDAAFRALSEHETVLGPSPDGGVWLIGLRAGAVSLPEFFESVPWLTSGVFDALVGNAPSSALLGEHSDLDRRSDAAWLREALRVAHGDPTLLDVLEAVLGQARSPSFQRPPRECRPPFTAPARSRAPPPLLLAF